MGNRMLRPAALLIAALLLAGCMPVEPTVTPVPEPSATPIFASDEDALAAATEAFANYLAVSDEILAEGGMRPERLLAVATPEWVGAQNVGFEKARAEKLHSSGSTTFDNVTLQVYDRNSVDGDELIRLYVCVDVSAVDILNAEGQSVVGEERPNRSPFEVVFDLSTGVGSETLLVANEDPWGGSNFCG